MAERIFSAKDIRVTPITRQDADRVVKRIHYSGKVVSNSQLHLGVFLDGRLEGSMQFGPSLDKRKIQGLVSGTEWNNFIELNRMAFSDRLPRNSESRALGVAFRLIRRHYPHIEWVVSFSDGAQCGDGTIYRASGFVLTAIKPNNQILQMADGTRAARVTMTKGDHIMRTGGAKIPDGAKAIPGFQLRYIYFLSPAARARLTVPVVPFDKIDELGAGMYRGERVTRSSRAKGQDSGRPPELGSSTLTRTLHTPAQDD